MQCLECSKNEEELNQIGRAASGTLLLNKSQRFNEPLNNNTQKLEPLECYGRDCVLRNVTSTTFIRTNVAPLNVSNTNRKNGEIFLDNESLLSDESIEDITLNAFTPIQHQTKIVNFINFLKIY